MKEPDTTSPLLDHLFRHQSGRITARLVRLLGPAHVALAEEAVQDALVRALQTWPYEGAPDNPAGWLFRVAHNVAIDSVRRDRTFAAKTESVVAELTRSYLRRYHLLLAVRGQLLLDLGRPAQAADAFRAALACDCSEPERRFLARRFSRRWRACHMNEAVSAVSGSPTASRNSVNTWSARAKSASL